jgi:hypothetical protein
MGKLIDFGWFILLIYSNEPDEPAHVHVARNGKGAIFTAKFWLEPGVALAEPGPFTEKELNRIQRRIVENRDMLLEMITNFKAGKRQKSLDKRNEG